MSWDRPFDFPVPGFRTLREAAEYMVKLPKAEQSKPHWQTAALVVREAAEKRGPMIHAHIGMNKALTHGQPEPVKEPRRKAVRKMRILG